MVSLESRESFPVKHLPEVPQASLSFDELGKAAFAVVDPGDLYLCIRPSLVWLRSFVSTLHLQVDLQNIDHPSREVKLKVKDLRMQIGLV